MKKFITIFMMSCAFIAVNAQDVAARISTAQQLANIDLKGNYVLANDLTLENWLPIGSFTKHFEGQLDGNGHTITIKNLAQIETSGSVQTGLFSVIGKKGVVKNLKISGEMAYDSGLNNLYIGAVAGINCGAIQNCISTCKITAKGGKINVGRAMLASIAHSAYANGAYAGGLTGINIGKGKIENCYATGDITVDGEGAKCAGGITGGNGGKISGDWTTNNAMVSKCFAAGTITTIGNGGAGTKGFQRCAGGIVGQNLDGVVESCVALNTSLTGHHTNCVVGINAAFDTDGHGTVRECYYQNGIIIFKSNENATPKTAKGEGVAVAISDTQAQEWWQTPKGKKSKFAFAFGNNDVSPWTWNETTQRPMLYWENQNTANYKNVESEKNSDNFSTKTETPASANGFDIITKKNGEQIDAKVLEIGTGEVKYKKAGNPNGPAYVVANSEIFMIKHADGSKIVFNGQQPQAQPTKTPIITPQKTEEPIGALAVSTIESNLTKNSEYSEIYNSAIVGFDNNNYYGTTIKTQKNVFKWFEPSVKVMQLSAPTLNMPVQKGNLGKSQLVITIKYNNKIYDVMVGTGAKFKYRFAGKYAEIVFDEEYCISKETENNTGTEIF